MDLHDFYRCRLTGFYLENATYRIMTRKCILILESLCNLVLGNLKVLVF